MLRNKKMRKKGLRILKVVYPPHRFLGISSSPHTKHKHNTILKILKRW